MQECFYNYYFYSVVSGIALVTHLIINWRQLFDWLNVNSRVGGREYRLFALFLSVFFMTDIVWGIFAELRWLTALYVDTVVFFLILALTIYAWTRYVVAYLEMGGWPRKYLVWSGRGLLAYFTVVMAVNHFNGSFFTIDGHSVFITGPMRTLTILLLIVFNVFSSLLTLLTMLHAKGALHRRNMMVFIVGVTMALAVAFQFGSPLLPFYALGFLFGCCLMHVFVFEDERDEKYQKEMLAHDYKMRLEAERSANKAKSLFFSSVSHDIRTPLNAIIGFSELLERGVGDVEERARYISSIRSSGKVLARLVDDILDLSKLESGRLEIVKEPTDVPALTREVIAACEVARARKSLALKSEIADMPCVNVDQYRIRQILFNLLSNAYKYTARGTITVRALWRDGTLTLSVSDTGEGIAEENIARILEPFVQVVDRNHRNGTGLGLPICQKLARLMGGELTVESKVGVGSTFTVELRNVQAVESPATKESGTGAAAHLGRTTSRVLIVDDSPVNRTVLKAMLAKSGVKDVVVAGNGREALSILEGDSGFDLVLTDLWMPEMDGLGLVRGIRADRRFAHIPVYLLTADVEARSLSETDGFTGVLIKPITLEKLNALFSAEEPA